VRNYLVKNKLFEDFLRSCFDLVNTIKNWVECLWKTITQVHFCRNFTAKYVLERFFKV